MTDDATRRKRRAHAIESVGRRAAGLKLGPDSFDALFIRAIAAMLAEVEENLCRKIGAKK